MPAAGNSGGGNDYKQRQRIITELAASGGLQGANRVATEVMFYLPPPLLTNYEQLFWNSFQPYSSPGSNAGDLAEVGVAKGSTDGSGLQASAGQKRYKQYWVITSEKAYRKKLRIDAKLTTIGEEIDTWMEEQRTRSRDSGSSGEGDDRGEERTRQCGKCSRFLAKDHLFCPSCGTRSDANGGKKK